MKPSELLRLVWINITQNKFKTIMTSIGIIVGAATIVMVIAIGKGGQEDVADQFKNLNAGAIDISYDGGDKNRGGNQSSDDSSDSGMMMMPSGSGAPSGSSSSGGSGASGGPSGGFTGGGDSSGGGPSGGPGGGNGGDGGGMPGDMGGFFGGGSDMEDRINQENITLDEDDVDDIETFVSGSQRQRSPIRQGLPWMAVISMRHRTTRSPESRTTMQLSVISVLQSEILSQNPMMRIKKKSAC